MGHQETLDDLPAIDTSVVISKSSEIILSIHSTINTKYNQSNMYSKQDRTFHYLKQKRIDDIL